MPEVGRPSKYEPGLCEAATRHCRLGATDAVLAEHFGIAESTLYEWKNQYPEFAEAIKEGKRPADVTVANALFDRACGAEWVEEQVIKLKRVDYDPQTGRKIKEEEYVEVVEVTRRAPADTASAIFWLKNRDPNGWRDKTESTTTLSADTSIAGLFRQIADNGRRIQDRD